MRLRIGRTLDGSTVSIDTARASTVVVLGDPGVGKTTLARYVVRWWLARGVADIEVWTRRPDEWSDLAGRGVGLTIDTPNTPLRAASQAASSARPVGLRVVDKRFDVDQRLVARLSTGARTNLVLGQTSWAGTPSGAAVACWGLTVSPQAGQPVPETSVGNVDEPLQSRLDWGCDARPLLRDPRGPHDFPTHRWVSCLPERSSCLRSDIAARR